MKKIMFFVLFVGILLAASNVQANTMAVTINTPSGGSSLNKGSSLTLNATVSCSGAAGKCNGLNLQYFGTLPTSSINPVGCGSPAVGESCTKTWTISADSVGSKTLNVTATSASADTTSSTVSITVNSVCGDEAIDGSEVCDGSNISSQICVSRGFDAGSLACKSDCTGYDTAGCSFFSCGNNIKEGNETCDGADLNNQTCQTRGFASGTLVCASNCGSFATSSCVPNPQTASGSGKVFGQMAIEALEPVNGQVFKNGESVPVKIKLLDGAIAIGGGAVNIKFKESTGQLIYDSLSGLYKGSLLIKNLAKGNYTLQISASHPDYNNANKSVAIGINPELAVAYQLEKEYILGSEIEIKGSVADFRNAYNPANVSITGYVGKIKIFEKSIDSNGTFAYRYKTSFFDIEGNWTIEVKAEDIYGNLWKVFKSVPVKLVSEGGFYAVKFLSPAPNFVYKRGESIKLTVEVEQEGQKIEGANFTFRHPDGNLIFLKEVSPGIYTADYRLGFDVPEGSLPLYVVGLKEEGNKTATGAAKLPINVEKTKLNLEFASPLTTDIIPDGGSVNIIIKAAYPDGSVPENLNIYFTSPEGLKIPMVKQGENFVGAYAPKENDTGVWKLQADATDPYGNSGSKLLTLAISDITLLYIISKNLPAVISVIIIAVLISGFSVYKAREKGAVKRLKKENEKLTELKKEAQKKYFKEGSIDKATYQQLMEKYEERGAEISKRLSLSRKKGK